MSCGPYDAGKFTPPTCAAFARIGGSPETVGTGSGTSSAVPGLRTCGEKPTRPRFDNPSTDVVWRFSAPVSFAVVAGA
jgi:hypothetical protein